MISKIYKQIHEECVKLVMHIIHIIGKYHYNTKLAFKILSSAKSAFYITFHHKILHFCLSCKMRFFQKIGLEITLKVGRNFFSCFSKTVAKIEQDAFPFQFYIHCANFKGICQQIICLRKFETVPIGGVSSLNDIKLD